MRRSILLTFMFAGLCWSQGQSPTIPKEQPVGSQQAPAKPQGDVPAKPNALGCTDADSAKSCHSFKQLLDAHDKEVLDKISSKQYSDVDGRPISTAISYVCLRPKDDAFMIVHIESPGNRDYEWQKASDGGQTSLLSLSIVITEYRDGVFYSAKRTRDNWFRFEAGDEPVFHSEATDGLYKGLKVSVDDSEIFVDYPFDNANGGKTQYSLQIRRSTGRFTENYSSTPAASSRNAGSCIIYR